MGITYTEIKLQNAREVGNLQDGFIEKAHEIMVNAVVDTGCTTALVINEEICQRLNLKIMGSRGITVAGGARVVCKLTEPITIHWQNRFSICHAIVMSGENTVLLGVIPLEDMDLMVDPVNGKLVGIHGDEIVYMVK